MEQPGPKDPRARMEQPGLKVSKDLLVLKDPQVKMVQPGLKDL